VWVCLLKKAAESGFVVYKLPTEDNCLQSEVCKDELAVKKEF